MKLTENFTLQELSISNTAKRLDIDNTPEAEQIANLRKLCINVLQPCRDTLGLISVNSGYRSEYLNKRIGGSKTSQHCKGMAADLNCDNNRALFMYIKKQLEFDQLIWEYGDDKQPSWVHVSFCDNNRKQVLKKAKNKPYETY